VGDRLEHVEVVFTLHAFKSIVYRGDETQCNTWMIRQMFRTFIFLTAVCKLCLDYLFLYLIINVIIKFRLLHVLELL